MENNKNKIFCIMDVNFNRVKEGLRVIEEYFRFYDINNNVTLKIRFIRHELDFFMTEIYTDLLKNRDTEKDFGRILKENQKNNVREIIIANIKRVEEGLRVLEEYSKIVFNNNTSSKFKELRFAAYDLEKELHIEEICNKKKL